MSVDRQKMLASDAEREQIALALKDAAGEGRLTLEELSDRLGLAYSARTAGELERITSDLPVGASLEAPAPMHTPASTVGGRKPSRMIVAIMSGARRRGRWRLEGSCFVVAVMGGCKLDLREAEIIGDAVDINIVNVMGGVDIVVPEGVDVEVSGLSVMGGKRVRLADVPVRPGTPLIRVRALSVMGGATIKSSPPRGARTLRSGDL